MAASVTAVALLLTACGNSDEASDDGIAGADEHRDTIPEDETAEPDDNATDAPDGIDRPSIELPDDLTLVFENAETGDPVQDAILADSQRQQEAEMEAVTSGESDRPALGFYTSGDALLTTLQILSSFQEENKTTTGTIRYFNWNVEMQEDDAAAVLYCYDETDSETRDRDSKEIDETAGSTDSILFVDRLELSEDGVWQTVFRDAEGGAPACQ